MNLYLINRSTCTSMGKKLLYLLWFGKSHVYLTTMNNITEYIREMI